MANNPAEVARDEAIDRVERSSELWILAAIPVAYQVAQDQAEFTTDDIWKFMREVPPEPRAMGAVMRFVADAEVCIATDRTRKSTRVKCHARPVRVWRSLIYKGTATAA